MTDNSQNCSINNETTYKNDYGTWLANPEPGEEVVISGE